ncbi:hypothetical protein ACJWDR_43035 [Streptomyces tauricus]|uniref:hypothetical protein n=1 Tax=Streptomyces tauricus TaxID=68274 RepID=UPI00387F24B0
MAGLAELSEPGGKQHEVMSAGPSALIAGVGFGVLLGLVKAELGDFQSTPLRWDTLVSVAYIAFAVLTGAISII